MLCYLLCQYTVKPISWNKDAVYIPLWNGVWLHTIANCVESRVNWSILLFHSLKQLKFSIWSHRELTKKFQQLHNRMPGFCWRSYLCEKFEGLQRPLVFECCKYSTDRVHKNTSFCKCIFFCFSLFCSQKEVVSCLISAHVNL